MRGRMAGNPRSPNRIKAERAAQFNPLDGQMHGLFDANCEKWGKIKGRVNIEIHSPQRIVYAWLFKISEALYHKIQKLSLSIN